MRTNNPEQTSRDRLNPICNATVSLRRINCPPTLAAPCSFIAVTRSGFQNCSAGASANTRLTPIATAKLNASTRPSRLVENGGWPSPLVPRLTRNRITAGASARPAAPPQHAEQQSLGQQLPQHPPALGAQGISHRELPHPPSRPHRYQARHVHGGHQHNQHHHPHHHQQRHPQIVARIRESARPVQYLQLTMRHKSIAKARRVVVAHQRQFLLLLLLSSSSSSSSSRPPGRAIAEPSPPASAPAVAGFKSPIMFSHRD